MTVTADTKVVVTFLNNNPQEDLINVELNVSDGGSLEVYADGVDGEVIDGSTIPANTNITLSMSPSLGYTIAEVLVNGADRTEDCQYNFIFDNYELFLYNVKDDLIVDVTFLPETGIGQVELAEAGYNGQNGMISVPAGAQAAVCNAAGQLVMNVAGGQQVSTSALSAGAYVLRVVAGEAVKVVKFIKK